VDVLENRGFIFIYGEPGTGKSHIVMDLYMYAEERGLNPLLIAAEDGTRILAREAGVDATVAYSVRDIAEAVSQCILEGRVPFVDSISAPYRSSPGETERAALAAVSAMMREAGGVAVGHARGSDDNDSPAWTSIVPWANLVARTGKVPGRGGVFYLELIKGGGGVYAFRVRGVGVEWI